MGGLECDGDSEVRTSVGHVELAFETEDLRTVCEDEARAMKELGPNVAEVLRHRLADLRAAGSPSDLLVGNPRVSQNNAGEFLIDLSDDYHIALASNHPRHPHSEAEPINWQSVRRVRLLRIGREQ